MRDIRGSLDLPGKGNRIDYASGLGADGNRRGRDQGWEGWDEGRKHRKR